MPIGHARDRIAKGYQAETETRPALRCYRSGKSGWTIDRDHRCPPALKEQQHHQRHWMIRLDQVWLHGLD